MANDYIPGPDGDFHIRQKTFVTYVNAHLADLGLAAGDVAAVNAAQATWSTAYPAHTDAQNAARAARQAKDGARDGLEGVCVTAVSAVSLSRMPRCLHGALLAEQWHTASVEGYFLSGDKTGFSKKSTRSGMKQPQRCKQAHGYPGAHQ